MGPGTYQRDGVSVVIPDQQPVRIDGSLLDELSNQYVITAGSKGMQESAILFKYSVRVALNPIISTVGGLLPAIISGETLTAIVLSLR